MSWTAEYNQCGGWHPMLFTSLEVQLIPGGVIKGEGADQIGAFTYEGQCSHTENKCYITKQYTGQHAVFYEGTIDTANGTVHGTWGFQPGQPGG